MLHITERRDGLVTVTKCICNNDYIVYVVGREEENFNYTPIQNSLIHFLFYHATGRHSRVLNIPLLIKALYDKIC